MESRRRNKRDNYRGSQNRKPPRGNCSWQPTVPSWEKEFCRVIGSLDWETLLQMKKFTHLYENVMKWDDSAGEEAFLSAKKRFWAEINGLPCNISLPDPNLYIDEINWDSDTDSTSQSDFDPDPVASNTEIEHDPVVIFGDSLLPNDAYPLTGWGDEEENFKIPANSSSANQGSPAPWMQNWDNSYDQVPATGWPSYSNNGWDYDGGAPVEYTTWGGGWNNDWGWNNYSDNNMYYEVQPHMKHNMGEQGQQSAMEERSGAREWNSFNSYGQANHHATITVGQTWNQ